MEEEDVLTIVIDATDEHGAVRGSRGIEDASDAKLMSAAYALADACRVREEVFLIIYAAVDMYLRSIDFGEAVDLVRWMS